MKKLKSVFYVMLLLLILGGVIGAIRFISSGNNSSTTTSGNNSSTTTSGNASSITTSEDTGKISIDEILGSSESSSTNSIGSISWGELS